LHRLIVCPQFSAIFSSWRVWRYQRGNQNLSIHKGQTTQLSNENNKRTKTIYKTYKRLSNRDGLPVPALVVNNNFCIVLILFQSDFKVVFFQLNKNAAEVNLFKQIATEIYFKQEMCASHNTPVYINYQTVYW
jgi:hypothetical protein